MDRIMYEFRVVFNAYDGQGDRYVSVKGLSEAIELRGMLRETLDKGTAWIEVRKVKEWTQVKIN